MHAAVSGRVVDQDGKPLAGVRVRAFPLEPTSTFQARLLSDKPERAPSATFETKEDGAFTIDTKAPVAEILFDAPNRELLTLNAADADDLGSILLRKVAMKRGRVTANGKGVAGAMVVIDKYVIRRTNDEGWYDIEEPSSQRLLVIHPGFAIADRTLRVQRANLDFALEPGVTVTGRTLRRNEPVAGVTITFAGWPVAVSGENGAFAVTHLPANWKVLGASNGELAAVAMQSKAAAYDVALVPAVSVSGTVRSTKTNAAIPGACAWITNDTDGMAANCHVTDAKGAFSASGLPAGPYRISATHPHYRAETAPPARLAEGARVNRSLPLIPLARVTGSVIDEERKPVAGALVSDEFQSARTRSGADGRFTLRLQERFQSASSVIASAKDFASARVGPISVEEGESKSVTIVLARGFPFRLHVVDRAGVPVVNETARVMLWDDEATIAGRLSIPCPNGDPARCRTDAGGNIDMRLVAGKYDVQVGGDSVPSTRLTGQQLEPATSPFTVTVDRGAPIEGRVTYSDGSPLGSVTAFVQIQEMQGLPARVESDGTFSLRHARPGANQLSVFVEGSPSRGQATEVVAPASGVVLTLPKPGRVEGKASDRATKQPLADFTVTLSRDYNRGRPAQVHSDDGTFAVENVSPATYDVVITAAGFAQGTVASVVVEEGKAASGIDVQLDRGATITGRVSSGGQPLASVAVGTDDRGPRTARSVSTDANGEYTFDGAPAGEQMLRFTKNGYVPARKSVSATPGKEVRLDVELTRGKELRGRVTDTSGRPIAQARVRANANTREMSGPFTIVTDVDGAFKLDGLSGDTPVGVTATKDGYLSATLENIDVNATPALTLTLERGGTILGRVIGIAPEEMGRVNVMATSGRARASARPDSSGSFTLQGVPDGTVNVMASTSGPAPRRSAPKAVVVQNGSAAPVTIDFVSGIAVRGRVTRANAPADRGMVQFVPQPRVPGAPDANSTIGSDGRYEVVGLEAGTYRVSVMSGAGRIEAGELSVSSSMTHDIELRGTTVRGRVTDATTGAPVVGATLRMEDTASRAGSWLRQETSDSNGAFAFEIVSDGQYRLRVTADRYSAATEMVIVSEGANDAPLEVRLRGGDRTALLVVDATTGRPVEAAITVTDDKREIVFSGMPPRDEEGASLLWLQPGRYLARIFLSGYIPATQELMVPGPTARVALTRAGRLVVQSARSGKHMVRVLSPLNGRPQSTVSLPPGIVESLPPGDYAVEIVDGDNTVVKKLNVTIIAGQTTTVSGD